MKKNLIKVYAAFMSGCLGNNILESYFPFFASVIHESKSNIIDAETVAKGFEDKYQIPVPLTFVRQVLSIGVQNSSIVRDQKGQYRAQKEILSKYIFDSSKFDREWEYMLTTYRSFCAKENFDISSIDAEERILKWIDANDESVIYYEEQATFDNSDLFDYSWNRFLTESAANNTDLFGFISSLSLSNIMKQAMFYVGDGRDSFKGLNVYLDTPMIFAILGMDTDSRVDSCRHLLAETQEAKCNLFVFDHNFQEISGIMIRAAEWATSSQYDISKANNVTIFFHDSGMTRNEIAEYCASLKNRLIAMNIYVKSTDYDIYDSAFQEDESQLCEMIERKYQSQNIYVNEEKRQTIQIDVRSIIMIYRARKGKTSTKIQYAHDIMLTLNSTIANISKEYESNRSLKAGHIPACISTDLFGTIIWLFSPAEMIEYQRKQVLADCYSVLRPTKRMLESFVQSLDKAWDDGKIDEKEFLFLRSHTLVCDALMNVTRGDYARFHDQTYLEVIQDIQEKAEKKFHDEALAHLSTQEALSKIIAQKEDDARQIIFLQERVNSLESQMQEKDQIAFDKKVKFFGWLFTLLLFGVPCLVAVVAIELAKNYFTDITWYSSIMIGILVFAALLISLLFKKGKSLCFSKVEKYLKKH